jgi:hypothetical protein
VRAHRYLLVKVYFRKYHFCILKSLCSAANRGQQVLVLSVELLFCERVKCNQFVRPLHVGRRDQRVPLSHVPKHLVMLNDAVTEDSIAHAQVAKLKVDRGGVENDVGAVRLHEVEGDGFGLQVVLNGVVRGAVEEAVVLAVAGLRDVGFVEQLSIFGHQEQVNVAWPAAARNHRGVQVLFGKHLGERGRGKSHN